MLRFLYKKCWSGRCRQQGFRDKALCENVSFLTCENFMLLEYFLSSLYMTQTLLVDVFLFDEVGHFIKQAVEQGIDPEEMKLWRSSRVKIKISHLCQFLKDIDVFRIQWFHQAAVSLCVYVCLIYKVDSNFFKSVSVCACSWTLSAECRIDVFIKTHTIRRDSEWSRKEIQDSACHLLLSTYLVVPYLIASVFFPLSTCFWSTQLVLSTCCPYLSSFSFFLLRLSLLPPLITVAFGVLISLPSSLVLFLF